MNKEEANEIYRAVIGATKGHPPGDPDERLEKIDGLMQPWREARREKEPKERKSRVGRDRLESSGYDRKE